MYVTGNGPNIFGHVLINFGGIHGFYAHVPGYDEPYPKVMSEAGYRLYLEDHQKTEIERIAVHLPDVEQAILYMEDLLSKKWRLYFIVNNCATFVREVLRRGGLSDYAIICNLPRLHDYLDINRYK